MKNKQCEAITLPSTYSIAHRCLKHQTGRKTGKQNLCPHHRTMAARKSP